MSIYAYVGLPGSGKSYNVVANVILPALRGGRRVVTNVPLYRDVVLSADGITGTLVDFPIGEVEQDPELISRYVHPGDVFVVDEVYKLWPSGMKTDKIPAVYKSLLAEHRHMTNEKGQSVHIVLAVQDLGSVAVFARRLVEQTFIHTKMGDLSMDGRFRVDIYSGAVTGYMGSDKMFIRSVYGEYSAEVWKFYQSHTKAQGVVGGIEGEKAVDRRGSKFKRAFFIYGLPIAIVAGGLAMWQLKREGDRMMHPAAVPKEVPSAAHSGFVDTIREPVRGSYAPGLPASWGKGSAYRVLGYIEVVGSPERSKALLVSESGQKISRGMSHCRFVDKDYFECEVDGEWYGQAGASLAAHETAALPMSIPLGAPVNAPLIAAGVAPERSEGAPAATIVDGNAHHLKTLGHVAVSRLP